jgi:DNA-binding CsgD family transcriptional regulator
VTGCSARSERRPPLGLTRREREVLGLICAGHTNAEIAGRLFISARTADHHVSAVLARLGAPTRNAAASKAAQLSLASGGQDPGIASAARTPAGPVRAGCARPDPPGSPARSSGATLASCGNALGCRGRGRAGSSGRDGLL